MEPSRPESNRKGWLLAAAGLVLLLLLALNSQSVEVNFILGSAEMPLFVALVAAAALGALVGWATPHIRSGRRRDTPPK
jgi:uncharacterized integral membrane protein